MLRVAALGLAIFLGFSIGSAAWADPEPAAAERTAENRHHVGLTLNIAPLGYYAESKDGSSQLLKGWTGPGVYYEADVHPNLRLGAAFSALIGPKTFIADEDSEFSKRHVALLSADFNIRPHWRRGALDPYLLIGLGLSYWSLKNPEDYPQPLAHVKLLGGVAYALDREQHFALTIASGLDTHLTLFYNHVFWLTDLGFLAQF